VDESQPSGDQAIKCPAKTAARRPPGRSSPQLRGERGSGTSLALAAIIVGCLLAVALLGGGAYAARLQQVSQAADLVAVSAAAKGCAAAGGVAAGNEVRLTSCQRHGDAFDQVVSVVVEGDFTIFGLTHLVSRTAYAGRLAA
jgi:hypothetical protein